MLLTVFLLLAGLSVLLGILFALGKGAGLIAGYNTAPASEKAKYDQKKLCKAMAKLMFALAICQLVSASHALFHTNALIWIGQGLFLITIVAGLIYMNTGNRFQK